MGKTLEELEIEVKTKGWHSVENALNLVNGYAQAYSEYLEKYNKMVKIFDALKEILPEDMMNLITKKLEENN
jgi:hypothetical protein